MGFLNNEGLQHFWQGVKGKLDEKVDKVEGKGLSTNDYTTAEKEKLAGIAEGANKTIVENVLTSTSGENALSAAQGKVLDEKIKAINTNMESLGVGDMLKSVYDINGDGVVDNAEKLGGQLPSYYAKAADIPTKVSQLNNDAGYLNEHQDISGKLDVDGNGSNVTVEFTTAGARANIASGDTQAVAYGKIAKYLADLKAVAFSGSYNDLGDKPEIPTVTNDLTDALKANYDAAYTHSQEAHAPANAQANLIESIKVNGTAQTITGKAVDITVPTNNNQLINGAGYQTEAQVQAIVANANHLKRAKVESLPTTGIDENTIYMVLKNGGETGDVYDEFMYIDGKWELLGNSAVDLTGYVQDTDVITNDEIDTILAN